MSEQLAAMLSDVSVCSQGLCGSDSSNTHFTEQYTDRWFHWVHSSHCVGNSWKNICVGSAPEMVHESLRSASLVFSCEELCMLLVPSEHNLVLLLHIRDCCTLQQSHAHFKNTLNSQKYRPDPSLTYNKLILQVNFKVNSGFYYVDSSRTVK